MHGPMNIKFKKCVFCWLTLHNCKTMHDTNNIKVRKFYCFQPTIWKRPANHKLKRLCYRWHTIRPENSSWMWIKAVAACSCRDGTFFVVVIIFYRVKMMMMSLGGSCSGKKSDVSSRFPHPPHPTPSSPSAVKLIVLVNVPWPSRK
jgi:hypothetical protein